jgi:hypothetical protein
MGTFGLLITILKHLPELLRIIELIEKRTNEIKAERKVKDDLEAIEQAFKNNDAEALNRLFNS